MNAIEVDRVSKRYLLGEDRPGRSLREAITSSLGHLANGRQRLARDEIWSLKDVSLTVAEGEAVGVIGRNGAGKTTLLKVLSRITEPTSGVARTRGRVTSLLEVGTGFHPELTGRENVYLNGAILGMGRKEIDRRFDEIASFAGVERFIDTPVKRYSSGMYLRLAFSVAAHLEPDIMVVDEVLAVGDAEFQSRSLGLMETGEREGRTVVFVSHNLDAISRLCSRAIWIEEGQIAAEGATGDVVEAYLSAQVSQAARTGAVSDPQGFVVLRDVRVVDSTGRPFEFIGRDEPFSVETRFSVRHPVPGLNVAIYIATRRGVEIIDEGWFDTERRRPNDRGEYIARLDIPPILNVGEYIVGVWIGTMYENLVDHRTAAAFRLEGNRDDRPKRAVVLGLPWTVTKVESDREEDVILSSEGDGP
jgi:ABC-2 type transport system ATP-binding protein/lipopolysaccharide transport system ATP-binding protein